MVSGDGQGALSIVTCINHSQLSLTAVTQQFDTWFKGHMMQIQLQTQ